METSTGAPTGLSAVEAESRLQQEGANELPRGGRRTLFGIVREVFREPMFRLLIAAGLVYLVLGDLAEALLLLAFALGSVFITVWQQTRTERALEALRDLSSPRALVLRDGVQQRIPGREVVRGDHVLLGEGDRVPADIRLLSAQDLQADESMLTGESVPVSRAAGVDGEDCVHSGTLIVRGSALGEVYATGPRSELGRIGQLVSEVHAEPTGLHRQTQQVVRVLAVTGLALSVLIAVLYGFTRGTWLEGLLAGIALAMALLPEEFPLVLTVFLALGAWRLAKQRVLTRRPAAIEALGAATVLCTDKTGTLTENRMRVAELRAGSVTHLVTAGVPAGCEELVRCARLASKPTPIDPMDRALHALETSPITLQLRREYGLRPELPAVTQVWSAAAEDVLSVAMKGAPEAVASLCGLDGATLSAVRQEIDEMAARGLRVLGVATAEWRGELPESPRAFALRWLGLVAYADPLRASAAPAIAECRAAGIRVVMITGDYPVTARAIAQQAGIGGTGLLTGAELEQLADADLREQVRHVNVYARVAPRQKLRIVEALKTNGEVVAMTGDGVNDAPSLKAAHIGVAMGGRGTDVAREAAGLVLLDDDFGSLVSAVRQGRCIYDNLRKAISYILAVHVPIAGLALFPLLFGWPMILAPVHIVFLELVIDPVCSIVFEAEREEADLMRRPPRPPRASLFSRELLVWSLLQGLAELALVTALFLLALDRGLPLDEARALAFAALVSTHFGLIFVNRSFGTSVLTALRLPNASLWRMFAVTAGLLALVLYLPAARTLFAFGLPQPELLALALLSGPLLLVLLEWVRRGLRLWNPGLAMAH